jgi:hypothetical protein
MKALASQDSTIPRQNLKCYIGPISTGLGDLIVSLPVVQAMLDDGYETRVVLRSPVQDGLLHRLEGLAGTIREIDYLGLPKDESAFYINLRNHPLQLDNFWGSPAWYERHGLMKIDQVVTEIAAQWAVVPNFKNLKPLKYIIRPETQGKIIFVPGSIGGFKCWPTAQWLALKDYFAEKNIAVLMLGQPGQSAIVKNLLSEIDWIETPLAADALDLISSARGVISVDTGLMHMAVHQGVPTIALYQNRPVYKRSYVHTKTIEAPPCLAICIENYTDPPENRLADLETEPFIRRFCEGSEDKSASVCMTGITVQSVINAIESEPSFCGTETVINEAKEER